MNTPMSMQAPQQINELPAPNFPMVYRFVSQAIFSDEGIRWPWLLTEVAERRISVADALQKIATEAGNELTWVLGQTHPLTPGAVIVRMFIDRGGVEIYSAPKPNTQGDCMRSLVPMSQIKIIEEAMPLAVFMEELAAAEEPDDDPDDPDDPDEPELPEPLPAPPAEAAPNGAS